MSSRFAGRFCDVASPRLKDWLGEVVSLVRGGIETQGVTARVILQEYQGEGEDGLTTTFILTDFVLDIDDYEFGGGAVEPRKGDRIKRVIGSTTHTYEVLPVPNGRVCEWADASGDRWKIHAKHIDP